MCVGQWSCSSVGALRLAPRCARFWVVRREPMEPKTMSTISITKSQNPKSTAKKRSAKGNATGRFRADDCRRRAQGLPLPSVLVSGTLFRAPESRTSEVRSKACGIRVTGRAMKIRAVAAITLGALAAYPAAAREDDTAAEIRFLKARLKQLEEKVARQDNRSAVSRSFQKCRPRPRRQSCVRTSPVQSRRRRFS